MHPPRFSRDEGGDGKDSADNVDAVWDVLVLDFSITKPDRMVPLRNNGFPKMSMIYGMHHGWCMLPHRMTPGIEVSMRIPGTY